MELLPAHRLMSAGNDQSQNHLATSSHRHERMIPPKTCRSRCRSLCVTRLGALLK
jgi:hypothetical protein